MSSQLFPTLTGQGWSISRTSEFSNRKPVSVSGKQVAIADWSYPRYTWEVVFNLLRQGSGFYTPNDSFAEMATLLGFFDSRQGGFDTFLYQDQDDNAVTNQGIGTGDGTTVGFQLARSFGGFVVPVLAPNVVSQVTVSGTPIAWGGLAAPTAPSLSSVAGGSLGGTTYFAKITYQTAQGETVPSGESSLAVAANNLLKVTSPSAAAGATGYNVYVSTSSGTETKQNTAPIAIGTAWTEPTSGLIAGASPPAASPTWSVSSWGTTSPGIVTFSSAPAAAAPIAASFSYYWPVRFAEDQCVFEKFTSGRYMVKKLTFKSEK